MMTSPPTDNKQQTIIFFHTFKFSIIMKKSLFFAAAALALASCSQDEVLEVNRGEAIAFRTVVNGNTRATEVSAFANDDVINVYADYAGSKYFQDDFKFNTTNGFHSTNKYYWPATVSSTKAVTFSAIFNADQDADEPGKISAFAPETASADQVDVLFAKTKVEDVTAAIKSTGVVLNFRHALSEVIVKVKNSNDQMKFDIKEVKFAYLSTQGDFDASAVENTNTAATATENHLAQSVWSNWSPAAASRTADDAYSQASVSAAFNSTTATALGAPWMLVPQTQGKATAYTAATADAKMNGAYIGVKMVIKNATDGAVIADGATEGDGLWCCWPANVDWKPGYKYTYTIDLKDGGYKETNDGADSPEVDTLDPVLDGAEIFFSASCTIDEWFDGADADVTQLP